MYQLLLVEDCPVLAQGILMLLGSKYSVTHAPNIADAKKILASRRFNLLLLDVTLPDGNGFELYQWMQTVANSPCSTVFLTGEGDLNSRVKGLELGAQDYILKPFYGKELLVRIEMQLKQIEEKSNIKFVGDLKFEKNLHRVFFLDECAKEHPLNLTPNKYKILSTLLEHKGRSVTRSELISYVWGKGFNLSDKAVNTHVCNLRKKMQSNQCQIVSTAGSGYQFFVSETVQAGR